MRFPLGTSAATMRTAPLLLVNLETEEGVTGRCYLFCYRRAAAHAIASLVHDAAELIRGELLSPAEAAVKLHRRFTLLGVSGVVRMALSAIDMALWDALATAAAQPLAEFLGGSVTSVAAYNSCGLGLMPPAAAAEQALVLRVGGFRGVKLRLGYPTLDEDLAAVRAVRSALPDSVALPVDYNQALSRDEARDRGQALESEGVAWLEEPIRHDDWTGAAQLRQMLAVPLQLGENFDGSDAMAAALALGSCDLVMPDVARIGGVTGWLRAAALSAQESLPMSSHLVPEISVHLLAVTPTRQWLEYVDWANAIAAEPLRIVAGEALIPRRPGFGLQWDDAAVAHYRMR
jgi:mandelate racemase